MDATTYKLGKLAPVFPSGMLRMADISEKYKLPTPPNAVAWYKGLIHDWKMLANDQVGNCVFAGAAHFQMLVCAATKKPFHITDAEVVSEYSRLTGYNPADPSTDGGAVISRVMQEWQSGGLFGRKIDGFVGINPRSEVQIKDAIWFFGAAKLGLALPRAAATQEVWDVPPEGLTGDGVPGSWGGHDVLLVGAGRRGVTMVTWGVLKTATWEFLRAYCDEAYAILSPDWLTESNCSPGGVPMASLRADLLKVARQ